MNKIMINSIYNIQPNGTHKQICAVACDKHYQNEKRKYPDDQWFYISTTNQPCDWCQQETIQAIDEKNYKMQQAKIAIKRQREIKRQHERVKAFNKKIKRT